MAQSGRGCPQERLVLLGTLSCPPTGRSPSGPEWPAADCVSMKRVSETSPLVVAAGIMVVILVGRVVVG